MNYLPAGGTVVAGVLRVYPVTLYTKQSFAHKRCFIRQYMQDEIKITSKLFERQSVSFRNKVISNHPHRVSILRNPEVFEAFSSFVQSSL